MPGLGRWRRRVRRDRVFSRRGQVIPAPPTTGTSLCRGVLRRAQRADVSSRRRRCRRTRRRHPGRRRHRRHRGCCRLRRRGRRHPWDRRERRRHRRPDHRHRSVRRERRRHRRRGRHRPSGRPERRRHHRAWTEPRWTTAWSSGWCCCYSAPYCRRRTRPQARASPHHRRARPKSWLLMSSKSPIPTCATATGSFSLPRRAPGQTGFDAGLLPGNADGPSRRGWAIDTRGSASSRDRTRSRQA